MTAPAAPVLIVIAGPAGSGKSTLCDRLVQECPEFARVVTTTTRAPRDGEINGVHYHFFSPAEFRARIDRGEFLEWAKVHGDNESRLYGTLKSSVLDPLSRGQNLVMSIDVQGVESLRRVARDDAGLRRAMSTVFIVVDHEEARKFDFQIESRTRDEDFAELLRIVGQARDRAASFNR
jgi:guanylate kinase